MGMLNVYLQNPYLMVLFIVWDLAWKGLALWKSAQKGQKYWFIALLIVNSMGLLPIIYLLIDKYSERKA